MKKVTVGQIMKLGPCYSRAQVEEMLPNELSLDEALPVLLGLDRPDTRWALARLLTTGNAVIWARACAERARGYSERDDTPRAAGFAAGFAVKHAAENAAENAERAAGFADRARVCDKNAAKYASELAARHAAELAEGVALHAEYAVDYAYSAAGYAAWFAIGNTIAQTEHRLACEHALELLREQE